MYIKQIIIQGFKSYRDQTILEPFSPKHNVIVGRNGSGKSNFFAAIRFALSDQYTSMTREERQALLHEGSSSAVMSAYVEVIFDNSDDRFPTGKNELVLRRTIGQKKDEYSLDRKNATKQDVMNLLESAGFSRSNPYYIVPQGRVTTLTNMKESERLNILKEVAGTQVYENRRSESLKIMADTDSKRGKIDGALSGIHERLDELEEEMEELRAYQDKDRERRCLEYTIWNREQEELNKRLDEVTDLRLNGADQTNADRDRFQQGEQEKAELEDEMKTLKQRLELLRLDRRQYETERKDASKEKAKIELEVQTLTAGQAGAQQAHEQRAREAQTVQQSIQDREAQLQKLSPQYDQARTEEMTVKTQLAEKANQRQRLYAKQGRSAKFKTKAERDKWLNKEIEESNEALATRKAVRIQTIEEIQALEQDSKATTSKVAELRGRLDGYEGTMQSLYGEAMSVRETRSALQDERKQLLREKEHLDSVLHNTQQEYDRAERFLSKMMDQNTSRGLASVRRIKDQHKLDGVYGPLAELFTVSDKFKTAVEVTGGASLFHVVVDTDDTATRLIDILQKEKAGRVTVMPLNRLNPKQANIPQANDAIEMISRLKFDAKYEPAMRQVFGRTIICKDQEIAGQYARSHGISAITPDGDRTDKKGVLSGGSVDSNSSRIDGVRKMMKCRQEHEEQWNRAQELNRQIDAKDQENTKAFSDLGKAEHKIRQAERGFEPMQREIRMLEQSLLDKQDALEAKRKRKEEGDVTTSELHDQLSAYEAELQSDFKKALSNAEEAELDRLNEALPGLKKQHMSLSTKRAELEAQKSTLDTELRENLRPRLDQLKGHEMSIGVVTSSSDSLKSRQKDLQKITKSMNATETKLKEMEQSIEELNGSLAQIQKACEDKQQELEELARNIERFQKRMEKSMSKKNLLTEQAAETANNIRDLGVLPEEAFTSYTRVSSEKAIKRLQSVKEALKKYSHVNKKAFEQYSNFTRQRTELQKRRSELDESQKSITDLIEVLDQRKDEAIERTFRQVSQAFATVFNKLVPAGKGRLVIQRKVDARRDTAEDDDDSEAERARNSVENYTGVDIAVSFNSKHDEQQRIQQLSGGQKSLCALALIFAIQACDPAPFYLFDEIDANLDPQYRAAVAELLRESSTKGQFICTTFRPEMLHVADKCYGVIFGSNKNSKVVEVDHEAALSFVEGKISGA